MSFKTLPLLFINLGGEMMYILDQRLKAQNIQQEKARKVLHDIIGTMFNQRFMEELFRPQELYSKKAMRTVFDRLAHASIMRLNNASMEKLYDLMTMAFKYQVSLCLRPSDILLVTLNHMDAMRVYVEGASKINAQVEHVYKLLIQHFASMSDGEFLLVRQTLLHFFQDMHIRVSIFLKDKVQNQNGRFVLTPSGNVPSKSEIPSTIRLFDGNGSLSKTKEFNCGGRYMAAKKAGSFEIKGDRVIKLGTNMYSVSRPAETSMGGQTKTVPASDVDPSNPNPLAKAQLDLLSKLISGSNSQQQASGKPEFRLNLFNTDQEEEEAAASYQPVEEPGSKVISIDARKKNPNAALNRIMDDLSISGSNDQEDDLLDLMDSTQ